jgi:hypothetical protein
MRGHHEARRTARKNPTKATDPEDVRSPPLNYMALLAHTSPVAIFGR